MESVVCYFGVPNDELSVLLVGSIPWKSEGGQQMIIRTECVVRERQMLLITMSLHRVWCRADIMTQSLIGVKCSYFGGRVQACTVTSNVLKCERVG